MFSAFNTKRKTSLRQGTDQVCLSHFQVRSFSTFGFCEAAVRAEANSHSPPVGTKILLTPWCHVPSSLSSAVSTLQVHSLRFFTFLCPPAHGDRLPDSLLILKHSSFPVKEPPFLGDAPPCAIFPHGESHTQITHCQIRTAAKFTGLKFK